MSSLKSLVLKDLLLDHSRGWPALIPHSPQLHLPPALPPPQSPHRGFEEYAPPSESKSTPPPASHKFARPPRHLCQPSPAFARQTISAIHRPATANPSAATRRSAPATDNFPRTACRTRIPDRAPVGRASSPPASRFPPTAASPSSPLTLDRQSAAA